MLDDANQQATSPKETVQEVKNEKKRVLLVILYKTAYALKHLAHMKTQRNSVIFLKT